MFEMACSVLAVSAVYNGMPSQEELSIGLKHSPSLKFSEEGQMYDNPKKVCFVTLYLEESLFKVEEEPRITFVRQNRNKKGI